MSRVSVVIHCDGQAEYVARAIYSCFRQEALREVIIVLSEAASSGRNELECIAAEFPLVSIVPGGTSAGESRNRGAQLASGDFLCFLGADDDLLSGFFSAAINELETHQQFSGVKVGVQFVDADYEPILLPGDPRYMAVIGSLAGNLLLRRSAFEKLGGFPVDHRFSGSLGGEDAAFSKALEENLAPLGYLPEAFYRVHNRPGSPLFKFMANTQVTGPQSFSIRTVLPEQEVLGVVIDEYLAATRHRFSTEG